MKTSSIKKLLVASLMSIMVPCVAFAIPVYVDHFTGPVGGQSITRTTVGTTPSFATGLGSDTMMGTRDVRVTKSGGSGGSHAVDINNGAYPSVLADSLESGVLGYTKVIWDSNSNGTIEYTAGPVDLTAGGINSFIQLRVLSNDIPGTVILNFGDGTTSKDYTFSLPWYPTVFPTVVNIPFTSWVGVDFTQIRGGGLTLNLLGDEDLRLDFIAADGSSVPEPSTFLLLGVGLGGLALLRRRK